MSSRCFWPPRGWRLDLRQVLQAVGQGGDILLRRRVLHRRPERLVGEIPAEADVLAEEGVVEHHVVLEDHAEFPPEVVQLVGAHVPAIHEDAARLGVVKPHEQVDHGGLAAARGADDAQTLAPAEGKAQVGEALLLAGLAVAEGDVLKADIKPSPWGVFPLIQGENFLIRHRGQHGFDAVGRGRSLAEHHKDAVDAHDALDDQVEVGGGRPK